ncbi:MAG: metal ABC transporter solute-binding protein, Zn/Mn family [Planctomycetota bacterium]|jgi:manganese/zinc/iron transport system substrate-binding protein
MIKCCRESSTFWPRAVAALALLIFSGCGTEPTSGIVATTGMVTDIVRVVTLGQESVDGLIGEGVDPHLFTPGRGDVQKLMTADVVVYSGLMLEGRMQQQFEQLEKRGGTVFAVTDGLDADSIRYDPEFEGHPDPHVWMDVTRWSQCVQYAADKLAEHNESSAAAYSANAGSYREKLKQLDDYVRQVIASIPESHRYLVTAHDAFEYFAEAYDIEVRSIQGISTDSQAGIADINELVAFIVEKQIPAIFVESSVPEKNIRAVIEGCADQGWELKVGGELFSDAMGPPGTYEGTYIGMMDHNATAIARALGGEAPDHGWQGKLDEGRAARPEGR